MTNSQDDESREAFETWRSNHTIFLRASKISDDTAREFFRSVHLASESRMRAQVQELMDSIMTVKQIGDTHKLDNARKLFCIGEVLGNAIVRITKDT